MKIPQHDILEFFIANLSGSLDLFFPLLTKVIFSLDLILSKRKGLRCAKFSYRQR